MNLIFKSTKKIDVNFTNVVFLTNYDTLEPFFSSITVISGIIPTLPG